MESLVKGVKQFVAEEDGATMVEYGLMLALIAMVCVGVISTLGTDLKAKFTQVATCIADSTKCPP